MTLARIALLLLVFSRAAIAQSTLENNSSTLMSDCRLISIYAADEIANGLDLLDIARVERAIASATKSCGVSEMHLRIAILSKILKKENASSDIQVYLENNYHNRVRRRILDSRALDFGYRYTEDESFYSYVPLRHRLDSVAGNLAKEVLATENLTTDERLMCILFSGDIDAFEKKSADHADRHSLVGSQRTNHIVARSRNSGAYALYTGMYAPIGRRDVIGINPVLGLTFVSPLAYKLSLEVGMKFRIHKNDNPFTYYAMGDTNVVDSDVGVFIGAVAGYKLYDNKSVVVQGRFGIGYEAVDTGLSEPGPQSANTTNSNNTIYYDVETVHLSAGLSVMQAISLRHYLGLTIDYHFCPYGFDANLQTKLDNSALSAELFLRF